LAIFNLEWSWDAATIFLSVLQCSSHHYAYALLHKAHKELKKAKVEQNVKKQASQPRIMPPKEAQSIHAPVIVILMHNVTGLLFLS
jgi:hypothetical protein